MIRTLRHLARVWQILLATLIASAAAAGPSAHSGEPRLVPAGTYVLERVLTRDLIDGQEIVVTRRWRISFAANDHGMTVRGTQLFADVAAPAVLAPLAMLEKHRPTEDMFPILLEETGLITQQGEVQDDGEVRQAVRLGTPLMSDEPPNDRESKAGFLTRLPGTPSSTISKLPRDLFFPEPGRHHAMQTLALEGGDTGQTDSVITSSINQSTGLMRRFDRQITTLVSGRKRVSQESWRLLRE